MVDSNGWLHHQDGARRYIIKLRLICEDSLHKDLLLQCDGDELMYDRWLVCLLHL